MLETSHPGHNRSPGVLAGKAGPANERESMTNQELSLRLRKISDALHEVAGVMHEKGWAGHSTELTSMCSLTSIYAHQIEAADKTQGACK